MAVYEHTYRRYAGELTPEKGRFLVLPRYAFREIFRSKLFLIFFVVCFIPFLIGLARIYVTQNSRFLELLEQLFGQQGSSILAIKAEFFFPFVIIQSILALLLTVFVAPALVSSDLTNNALPLYLSRPLSRAEYVVGKMTVLVVLLSSVTWVPLMILFGLQSYLKDGWFREFWWIAPAILVTSAVWILVLSLLGLAFSAWVKWKPIAGISIFAVFFVSLVVGQVINAIFNFHQESHWGDLVSLPQLFFSISLPLFREPWGWQPDVPVWSAWVALALFSAFCLFLLARKVRAYEVVK